MKAARLVLTIALLLFVGATVGTLIAQEVTRPEIQMAEESGAPVPATGTVAAMGDSTASASATGIPGTASAGEPDLSTVDAPSVAEPGSEAKEEDEAASIAQSAAAARCVIDAIYFHNTRRCYTCVKIEREAREIVQTEFAEELAAGTLRWSAINMEAERQYVNLYDLAMPSLVLVRSVGDEVVEWLTLEETWSLIRSQTRFSVYIVDGFRAFLEGCP